MSRTISLYSSAAIAAEELFRFIADEGGEIFDDKEISGRVSSGSCHVWFYGLREQLAGSFEEPEEDVIARLGAPVMARVDLHLSHHEGSSRLALRLAHRFAERWPAVATVAARLVLTGPDVARLLAGARVPPILSASLQLMFVSTPEPGASISAFGGLVIDRSDPALLDSAGKEVGALDGARYDPTVDRILGFIPSGDTDVWILHRALTGPGEGSAIDPADQVVSMATRRLGARPSSVIRVLIGYNASREGERVALDFSDKLLRTLPGVAVGIFGLILDLQEIEEMIESDPDLIA